MLAVYLNSGNIIREALGMHLDYMAEVIHARSVLFPAPSVSGVKAPKGLKSHRERIALLRSLPRMLHSFSRSPLLGTHAYTSAGLRIRVAHQKRIEGKVKGNAKINRKDSGYHLAGLCTSKRGVSKVIPSKEIRSTDFGK